MEYQFESVGVDLLISHNPILLDGAPPSNIIFLFDILLGFTEYNLLNKLFFNLYDRLLLILFETKYKSLFLSKKYNVFL